MSNPLIPQQRADKNGKIVTRHVKADIAPSAGKLPIPAPVMGPSPERKPIKLLDRQMKTQVRMTSRAELNASPELCAALGHDSGTWRLATVAASEEQVFDVFSVVSIDNAVNMLDAGINSAHEALEFLDERNLNHLIVDRREMMNEALATRVDSFDMIDMHVSFGMENYDGTTFVEATRVKGSLMLPYVGNGDGTQPGTFYEGVLKGEIDYKDLTEVTYSAISMSSLGQQAYEGLKAIKNKSVDFGPDFLKKILSRSERDPNVYEGAIQITKEYGEDFALGIVGLQDATALYTANSSRGSEYCRSLIEFNEKYQKDFDNRYRKFDDVKTLHDAGVDPSDAAHLKSQGMSVEQIVSARESGITGAVTGGWL